MADTEHVAKLLEGVEVWNAWVSTRPEGFQAYLGGADLARGNLDGANLRGAETTVVEDQVDADATIVRIPDALRTTPWSIRVDVPERLPRVPARGSRSSSPPGASVARSPHAASTAVIAGLSLQMRRHPPLRFAVDVLANCWEDRS